MNQKADVPQTRSLLAAWFGLQPPRSETSKHFLLKPPGPGCFVSAAQRSFMWVSIFNPRSSWACTWGSWRRVADGETEARDSRKLVQGDLSSYRVAGQDPDPGIQGYGPKKRSDVTPLKTDVPSLPPVALPSA